VAPPMNQTVVSRGFGPGSKSSKRSETGYHLDSTAMLPRVFFRRSLFLI
jgi:hypothetical protein